MRRLFHAFLVSFTALSATQAQLPPEAERFPQAPALPGGEVVSKPLGSTRPVVHGVALNIKPVAAQEAPLPTTGPKPTGNYITATVMPVAPTAVPNSGGPVSTSIIAPPPSPYGVITHPGSMAQCGPECAPVGGCTGCGACKTCPKLNLSLDKIDTSKYKEWLKFHSTSRHEGCHPTQSHPALHTWFDCKPKWGSCGYATGCGAPSGNCKTGCGTVVEGQPIMLSPGSTVIPGAPHIMPAPGATTDKPAPAVSADKKAEDTLSSFRQLPDGIGFTPGGSPMAAPTTGVPVKLKK